MKAPASGGLHTFNSDALLLRPADGKLLRR